MNENLGNLIENDSMQKYRRNSRIAYQNPTKFNDEKSLIDALMNTNPEDENSMKMLFKNLSEYYMKKSISNSDMIEQVFGFLYELMRNENSAIKIFGMKCFICIFCQDTYIFDKNYAQTILAFVVSHDNFDPEDAIMIQHILHIISKITTTSNDMAQLASKYIDIEFLAQICLSDISIDIKDKAICILDNLCCSIPLKSGESDEMAQLSDGERDTCFLDDQFVDMICNISEQLLPFILEQEKSRELKRLMQSIISCCYSIAKRFDGFHQFFEGHNLYPMLSAILDDETQPSKTIYDIIRIAEILYHDPGRYEIISIEKIYSMIVHPNSIIQIASLQCILNTLQINHDVGPIFMSNGIVPIIFEIFQNGCRKGKSYCVELLFELYELFPQDLTPVIATQESFDLLCSFLQEGSKRKITFVLKILMKLIETVSVTGEKGNLKEMIESTESYNEICLLANHDDAHIAELANLLIEQIED